MPCTPQSCPDTFSNIGPNYNLPLSGFDGNAFSHYANMGWVGFAKLKFGQAVMWGASELVPAATPVMLRVTGADLKLSQEISRADVLDGRIDSTAYWLGPKIIEGSMNFPLIADNLVGGCPTSGGEEAGKLMNAVWQWAVARDPFGRMCYSNTDIILRYANHAAFKYAGCIVNTMSLKVTQGDMITMDLGVMARNRTAYGDDGGMGEVCPLNSSEGNGNINPELMIPDFLAPARVLTWNDITINGVQMEGAGCATPTALFYSNQIRDFSLEINNNADRFFTLNGTLAPVDINVSKREITGSMTLLGYNHALRRRAETNQDRFTSKDELRIAAYIGDDQGNSGGTRDWWSGSYLALGNTITSRDGTVHSPIFARKLRGVIFQIEEVSLAPKDVLETTVNYLALGTDNNENDSGTSNYESVDPASSCGYPIWSTDYPTP